MVRPRVDGPRNHLLHLHDRLSLRDGLPVRRRRRAIASAIADGHRRVGLIPLPVTLSASAEDPGHETRRSVCRPG